MFCVLRLYGLVNVSQRPDEIDARFGQEYRGMLSSMTKEGAREREKWRGRESVCVWMRERESWTQKESERYAPDCEIVSAQIF